MSRKTIADEVISELEFAKRDLLGNAGLCACDPRVKELENVMERIRWSGSPLWLMVARNPDNLVEDVRGELKSMSDAGRQWFFDSIIEGYCRHCGRDDSELSGGCQCENDE